MAVSGGLCGRLHGGAATAQDVVKEVRRAVENSTLDQAGTKSFHLKAEIGPLRTGGEDAKSGSVEIWWESPERWRRELHSKEFSQVEIVNGGKDWQKNDGDFFPEWLREAAVAVVKLVPDLVHVLAKVKTAEVKQLSGETHISWVDLGSDGTVSKGIGSGLTLRGDGSLAGGSGVGWSCYVERTADGDFIDFHGRKVPRQVESGGLLRVTLLEDLKEVPPGFFDAQGAGDASIRTLVVDELEERRNLISSALPVWPPLEQGPLTGATLSDVVIDRTGALVKSFATGLEVRRMQASEFDGLAVARSIEIYKSGRLAMHIAVTKLEPATAVDDSLFVLKGHDYKRQFTAEVR